RARVLEGALEVVHDGQKIVDESGQGDLEVLLALALAAFLVVLELGELAQVPVLELLEVLLERPNPVLRRGERARLFLLQSGVEGVARVAHLHQIVAGIAAVAVPHSSSLSARSPSRRSRRSETARP